ncbi:MAG: toast rack family protein [Candidatus Promineifilaceae bacterium]
MVQINPNNSPSPTIQFGFKIFRLPRAVLLLPLMVAMLFSTSCDLATLKIGPLKTEAATVELGGARSVQAELSMGTGRIKLAGGAPNLMDGTFIYNVDDWQPEVQYTAGDDLGHLSVSQPAYKDSLPVNLGDIRYEWDLRLNSDVPMVLSVTMGAGEGDLVIADLLLDSFKFKGGAGGVRIDLRGSSVSDLDVALGAGDVILDLSGVWQQDLNATIKGGLGRVTLILPSSSGARVTTRGMLSKINALELTNDGGVYTNDAYGLTGASMRIDIESGIGEIVMKLGV